MKKLFFYLLLPSMFAVTFVACSGDGEDESDPVAVTFEMAELDAVSGDYTNLLWGKKYMIAENGSFEGPVYTESGAEFNTFYAFAGYDEWYGFAVSSTRDVTSEYIQYDVSTQFNVYAQTASKFAVGYMPTSDSYGIDPVISFAVAVNPVSVKVANNTYTYLYVGQLDNNEIYYNVIATGYNGDTETGKVTISMVRDGVAISDWTTVALSGLGSGVTSIKFGFETNDVNEFGAMMPTYFCLDDLYFIVPLP